MQTSAKSRLFLTNVISDLLVMVLSLARVQVLVQQLAVPVLMLVNKIRGQ